jgi:transposase
VKRLEAELADRDRRIKELEQLLDEAQRAAKRQAAPFSKGEPKASPRKPGRKAGKRYGRRVTRPIPKPDKVFEVPCPRRCSCGGPVEETGSTDLYQVDIPPARPETWKFVMHHGICGDCGKRVRGEHPLLTSEAFEVGTVHLGPGILALAAYLKQIGGMSYGKIRDTFSQMLGVSVARSTLCRAMRRLGRKAEPTFDALVRYIRGSPVVYPDESGWKISGRTAWLWVFTTGPVTVYSILPGRGYAQAVSVLGEDYAGTLGADGWAPYRKFTRASLQTCTAHLLRRCKEMIESGSRGAARFPAAVKAVLKQGLALRDRRDAGEIKSHGLRVAKGRLESRMDGLLAGRPTNAANRRLAKHLRVNRENLFVYLDDPDVEATNWRAEQEIRMAVVNRKTCGGGSRTHAGARTQSILSSVLRSACNLGHSVADVVRSILRRPAGLPVLELPPQAAR